MLTDFESILANGELRERVLALVSAFRLLRDLGSSLVPLPGNLKNAGRQRILQYFRSYPQTLIHGDELLVVSGIQEYARRIRELRVQYGWPIFTGHTTKDLIDEEGWESIDAANLKVDTYILLIDEQDREAAHRWNIAKTIRNEKLGVKKKLLLFLRENVGKPVTGEELRYVAKSAANWPRRVRELRTDEGWPIKTKNSGRPDLSVGVYILEEDREGETHDRNIIDATRVEVLNRDGFKCCRCKWNYELRNISDPRHMLELHHIAHHIQKGENTAENLVTLCNVCHDEVHRKDSGHQWSVEDTIDWVKRGV